MLIVVPGCSKQPEPIEPDPTPTPVEPVLPEAAKENTEDGALAFLEHYLAVMDYASSTGDVTQLTELSHPECTGCRTYIDLYTDYYEGGGWFKGGDQTLDNTAIQMIDGEVLITADISLTAGSSQAPDADVPSQHKASTEQVTHGMFWVEDRWLLTQMFLGEVPTS
ncbi:MAG: DUF6318 family protein [Aeromicrobium sp.]|uniref:DUF6318 family protein n=1 Tax=Aeromicrobium sp. TaxID=1871063 RepID=UPI0039E3BEE4